MKNIILDTDIGADSDDIGAVAILQNLAKQKVIKILAMTCVSSDLNAAKALDIINEHYHNAVPIGINKRNNYGVGINYGIYTAAIVQKYGSLKNDFPDSVELIKNSLKQSPVKVTLVAVGPLNNIRYLLEDSEGYQLVRDKVEALYLMGGAFTSNLCEWNLQEDLESANYVLKYFPNKLIMVPFEIGQKVLTGKNLISTPTPMQLGYQVHAQIIQSNGLRESWDPITVYLSCYQNDENFIYSLPGTISLNSEGVTSFIEGNGNHYYILENFNQLKVTQILDELMIP